MSQQDTQDLLSAYVLELNFTRSTAGQTAEVTDGAGKPLAAADGAGTISDPAGVPLLVAPLAVEGQQNRMRHTKLAVSDGAGAPLGEVQVVKYSFGPRSSKVTLSLTGPGGEEVARIEPQDKKGEHMALTVRGAPTGTLEQFSRKRGLLKSSSSFKLELSGEVGGRARALVVAAAVRFQALSAAAQNATQDH